MFLIDDIWPTASRPEGYLPDLEGLLQGSPNSRILLSTRSVQVAANGSHVDFGARDPCGPLSVEIFLANAAPEMHPNEDQLDAAKGILNLCSGLPFSLSVAGAAVSLRMKAGVGFEYACRMYFERLCQELELYPGCEFLENAIRLSLTALAEECDTNARGVHESTEYSLSELYISLCVLENQQCVPIAVLARMWQTSESIAEEICFQFSTMSLAKISPLMLDGREQCVLHIHDLHLEYCRRNASRSGDERVWHRRLLNGHMAATDVLNEAVDYSDGSPGFRMLEYEARKWWQDDVPNKQYIRQHLSRHLLSAGLDLELGTTVLDLRWICAQGQVGGVLGLKNDLDILQATVENKNTSASSIGQWVPVKLIADLIAAMSAELHMGPHVVNQRFNAYLFLFGKTNDWIRRFLERMSEAMPKPFLVPTVSFYRHPVDDMKLDINLRVPGQSGSTYFMTDFSRCERFCAGAANHGIVVLSMKNQSRLKWLRGHDKNVNVVKFSTDARKLISGSLDCNVIIWDWQQTESPSFVLKSHKGGVTSLSLSGDDSKLYSGSRDGTVKMWDMSTGELRNDVVFGSEVECVASCPTNEVVAVGTRDGRLRCRDWVSGQFVFEHSLQDNCTISTMQFGVDGKVLVCGSDLGMATAWYTEDWKKAASVRMPGSITNIALHPDGTNIILGSSQGEIRHWIVAEKELSKYNVSMARPVNGISFLNNGDDIIVGVKLGGARVWSGPQSNPSLDFEAVRNNLLFDFSLSNDGNRVATTTHDCMIRIWSTETGAQIASYEAPAEGSRCLALSADGTKLASSSANGTIRIWNAEMAPLDADISFTVSDTNVHCLSFSQDRKKLLICVEQEVQVWNLESRQMVGRLPSSSNLDASFSRDGQFVIVGNPSRASIWDATSKEIVFDSVATAPQKLSFQEAKDVIQSCGSTAHRMCPSSLKAPGAASRPGTVDTVFNFASYQFRSENVEFCEDVFVLNFIGMLTIFKMQT